MKTLNEILAKAGVEADIIAKVETTLKGAGKDGKDLEVIVANTGDWVKATKHDALQSKFDELEKESLDLRTLSGKSKEASVELGTVKAELEKLKLDKSNAEQDLRIAFEFEKKLLGDKVPPLNGSYNAYVTDDDRKKVSIKDGKFTGIDEAYESIKTRNKDAFEKFGTVTIPGHQLPPGQQQGQSNGIPKNMNEWIELKNTKPALYEQLWPKRHELERQQSSAQK